MPPSPASGGILGFSMIELHRCPGGFAAQPACEGVRTPMKKRALLTLLRVISVFGHDYLEVLFKHSCDVAQNDDSASVPDMIVTRSKYIFRIIRNRDLSKDAKESLFLIFNELLLSQKVMDTIQDMDDVAMLLWSRSDGRFEVVGSANKALNAFMNLADVGFCFGGLIRVFEEHMLDLWTIMLPTITNNIFDSESNFARDWGDSLECGASALAPGCFQAMDALTGWVFGRGLGHAVACAATTVGRLHDPMIWQP
ncbi:hypothetical protein BC830DRAFT_1084900 [Chytriomyces sp. MP71]|nr:hypothetical protein BC830DRAFT_1084900 [Chytriomyces sp. MP71]